MLHPRQGSIAVSSLNQEYTPDNVLSVSCGRTIEMMIRRRAFGFRNFQPNRTEVSVVDRTGVEPVTPAFSVLCSTN